MNKLIALGLTLFAILPSFALGKLTAVCQAQQAESNTEILSIDLHHNQGKFINYYTLVASPSILDPTTSVVRIKCICGYFRCEWRVLNNKKSPFVAKDSSQLVGQWISREKTLIWKLKDTDFHLKLAILPQSNS